MGWKIFKLTFALSLAGILLPAGSAMADALHLTTGRVIQGNIVNESRPSVTIETPEGRFTFPRQRIKKIEREGPAQNRLREITTLLDQGQVDLAISTYEKENLDNNFAAGTLESLLLNKILDSATALMLTTTTVRSLADRLALSPHPTPELLLFTATQAAENRQLDIATKLVARIQTTSSNQFIWSDRTINALTVRLSEAAIRNNHGELIAASVQLSTHLGSASATDDLLSVYAQIQSFHTAKDYPRSTTLFRPELFLHRSDIFVPLAEKVMLGLLKSADSPPAITALESARITIFPYIDDSIRKEALRALILGLSTTNRIHRAQQIADEIAQKDPDLGAYGQHLVEFRRRQDKLPADKPLEIYKLATWARTMGLLHESRSLLSSLQKDPRFTPNVTIQLQLIDLAQGQQDLARLNRLYKAGDYRILAQECRLYLEKDPPEEFASKARDLIQLADFHQWNDKNRATHQAEAEYQHAERLANRGDYDAALAHLNKLQTDLQDTAAAAKAAALRDKILRAKMISRNTRSATP